MNYDLSQADRYYTFLHDVGGEYQEAGEFLYEKLITALEEKWKILGKLQDVMEIINHPDSPYDPLTQIDLTGEIVSDIIKEYMR